MKNGLNETPEYMAPQLDVTEIVIEGILCQSGLESPNSIPDMIEDDLNW